MDLHACKYTHNVHVHSLYVCFVDGCLTTVVIVDKLSDYWIMKVGGYKVG